MVVPLGTLALFALAKQRAAWTLSCDDGSTYTAGSLDAIAATKPDGSKCCFSMGEANKTGCTDINGVVGTQCEDICECGSMPCPSKEGASDDYSRCYEHDPATMKDSDECADDVRCCIPVEDCPTSCNIAEQETINLLMLAFTNSSSKECKDIFLSQLHGIAQDEYELCLCFQNALDELESSGTIAQYNSAVQALNDLNCRMTDGEIATIHQITLMCMSSHVIGDPFLAVGQEKIKFFLPPGEMVDLVTWQAPSGKAVALRGSTFQAEGSSKANTHKNVQWFRKFEMTMANETILSITSFHKREPRGAKLAIQPSQEEEQENEHFTAEHEKRKSFIGLRLDGEDVFPEPFSVASADVPAHPSRLGAEIGLKVSAVQTKEHKIGGEYAERVDVKTDKLQFRVWSSKAGKYTNPNQQVQYAHLNLNILGAFPAHVGGFFAELRGKAPMSAQSKSYLRKSDLEPPALA
jgi:hypothetical protein